MWEVSGQRPKGRDVVVARFGSERSYVLRLLYSWLTLSILYLFPWPLLVIYAGAPSVSIENTPIGWYLLRLLAPALTAVLVFWLWSLSPVPAATAARGRAMLLLQQGRTWPQVVLILIGTIIVIAAFSLFENPSGGIKLLLLTLAEAVVIQIINSGYLHGAFDLVLDRFPAALAATGLYALTFTIRAALATASEANIDAGQFFVAVAAGFVVGAGVGSISAWLRARSNSLLPGFLALWLTFIVLNLPEFYQGG